MAKCERDTIASLVSSSAATHSNRSLTCSSFCPFPLFSATSLRRKLLEALACGISCSSSRRKKHKPTPPPTSRHGSDRLSDLLKAAQEEEEEEEEEVEEEEEEQGSGSEEERRKEKEMKAVVERLTGAGRGEAAEGVRRLAKDDREARVAMAMLGAIPSLVGMIDEDGDGDEDVRISAVYALLNLGVGNDVNKAAIVKAGAIHRMLHHLSSTASSPPTTSAIIANFLSLTALDANKPIIGISGAMPFLTKSFATPTSPQSKKDSLRALYNLSLHPPNTPHLLDSGLLPPLLASICTDTDLTSRSLSILSNLVSTPAARRALTQEPEAVPILVDVLNWGDDPECQEKAAYVLMVLAYKGCYADRVAMVETGIVSACLELTLLGSALAQKRASRILEFLTVDKGKQVSESFVSAPTMTMVGMVEEEEGGDGGEVSEERMTVKQLVQQSLHSNMRRIARRANLPQESAPSEQLRPGNATPTTKSLPF